ncbi:MAG: hypothetical protein KH378_03750 [Butyrivibrio sp.]|nr:hypothetical protein [Butyrivibrio sp.]
MKIKLLIAAFTLGIAIAGSTAANAGTRQNYASLDNKTLTALCMVTKDNDTNGSYVTYRSGVGVNAQVRNTVFKCVSASKRVRYTPSVTFPKGTRYWMGSLTSLPSLKKGDQIELVAGTRETSDTIFYTWEYN